MPFSIPPAQQLIRVTISLNWNYVSSVSIPDVLAGSKMGTREPRWPCPSLLTETLQGSQSPPKSNTLWLVLFTWQRAPPELPLSKELPLCLQRSIFPQRTRRWTFTVWPGDTNHRGHTFCVHSWVLENDWMGGWWMEPLPFGVLHPLPVEDTLFFLNLVWRPLSIKVPFFSL